MNTVIVDSSPEYAVGIADGIVAISVARGAPSLKNADAQTKAVERVVEKSPKNCAWFCFIEPTSPKPSPSFQRRADEMLLKAGSNLCAVAYVIEGTALRDAFVRAFMAGVTVSKGTPQPCKHFKDLDSAEKWVRGLIKLPSSLLIAQAVEQVRAAITK